jgi:hypothetical protein
MKTVTKCNANRELATAGKVDFAGSRAIAGDKRSDRRAGITNPGARVIPVHWTNNGWASASDTPSTSTGIGIEFADIAIHDDQSAPLQFTFLDRQQSLGRTQL